MKKRYDIKEDHKQIKLQIKDWELRLDKVVQVTPRTKENAELLDYLDSISNEMMAINI